MNNKKFSILVGKNLIQDFSNVLEVKSPINNQVIGIIPKVSTKNEIDEIFINAKNSFSKWKNTPYNERKNKILNFISLLKKHEEEIVEIMVWEIAKNRNESLAELKRSIEYIELTIKEYENIFSNPLIIDEKVHHVKNKVGKFIYQPLGVVLTVSPFNYPLNLLLAKIIPALISANVVVYKPATQGSCLGAFISTLLYEAGFNEGQVSCLIGKGSEIGDIFIANKNIDMISFTGSTSIGKKIAQIQTMIPLVLEMGGKDPAIILEDADLELASNEIIKGAFSYNGQRCTAIKRVIVHKNIHQKLIEILDKKLSKLSIGSALDNCDITELISEATLRYNLSLIDDAIKLGAQSRQEIKHENNILHPVILDNVSLKSKIAWEEPFGPILPIIEFDNLEDAIAIANKSEFGLQASVFTKNYQLAEDIALKLECGTVNINRSSSRGPDIFPFSGIKDSGFGLQGIRDAIISMNRIKGIVENK